MQGLGIVPDTIDKCQNHVLPGSKVRRHYLHYDFAQQKLDAWEALGKQLQKHLDAKDAATDRSKPRSSAQERDSARGKWVRRRSQLVEAMAA